MVCPHCEKVLSRQKKTLCSIVLRLTFSFVGMATREIHRFFNDIRVNRSRRCQTHSCTIQELCPRFSYFQTIKWGATQFTCGIKRTILRSLSRSGPGPEVATSSPRPERYRLGAWPGRMARSARAAWHTASALTGALRLNATQLAGTATDRAIFVTGPETAASAPPLATEACWGCLGELQQQSNEGVGEGGCEGGGGHQEGIGHGIGQSDAGEWDLEHASALYGGAAGRGAAALVQHVPLVGQRVGHLLFPPAPPTV